MRRAAVHVGPTADGAAKEPLAPTRPARRCTMAAALALLLQAAAPPGASAQPSAAERAQAEEMVRQMDRRIEELKRDIAGSQDRLDALDRESAAVTAHRDRLHGEAHLLALRFRDRYRDEHGLQQIKRRLMANLQSQLRLHGSGPALAGDAAQVAGLQRDLAQLRREMAALEAQAPLGLAQRLLGGQVVRLRPDGVLVAVSVGTPGGIDTGQLLRPAPSGDQIVGDAERGIVVDLLQAWSGLANDERTIRPLVDALNRDAPGLQACRLQHPAGGERLRISLNSWFAPPFMVDRHRILRLRMQVQPERAAKEEAQAVAIETFIPLAAVAKVEVEPRLGLDCWTVHIQCNAAARDCAQVTVLGQTLQAAGTLTLHAPGPAFATRAAELLRGLARAAALAAAAGAAPTASPPR